MTVAAAETIKYFYMLFEDDVSSNPVLAAIEGKFILNTEGHILRFNESFYEVTGSSNCSNTDTGALLL